MPNRYLRASYVDSKAINRLTAEGERLFCRLLVHVDDFGRCEADPDLLRGKLFSRQLDKVSDADVKAWIEELAKNGVLFLYDDNGQTYVQMNKWEQGRAHASKCPHPPTDVSRRLQMFARENISPDPDPDPDTDCDTDTAAASSESDFDAFWASYPRKIGRKAALKAWQKATDRPSIAAILDAIAWQRTTEQWRKDGGQYIPMPATWLNQGRWADERGAPVTPAAPSKPKWQRELDAETAREVAQ